MSTKRHRYTVTRVDGTAGRNDGDDVWVREGDEPEYACTAVWRTFHRDGTVDVACASCSTPLTAMSASCAHARAAKYATMHGKVKDEKVPAWWKPKAKAPPPAPKPAEPPAAPTTLRQPANCKLEIEWRQHQPSVGPSLMRAYVGPHRVGNVTRALTGKGYVPACFLPGAHPVPSMFTEQEAMQEVERVVRLWFEDIPDPHYAGR